MRITCTAGRPPVKTAVKTKAKKTNNQASFGGSMITASILKAIMEVEAAVELAHDLDATGMHCVWLHCVSS